MSGPAPKPTALRLLEGNRGNKKISGTEPKPKAVKPAMPKWLCKRGRPVWSRLLPVLMANRLMTEADVEMFAMFCQAYGRYLEAESIISKKGMVMKFSSGAEQVRPEVSTSAKMMEKAVKIAVEFGLTPSSRSRISIAEIPVDEFEDLLD